MPALTSARLSLSVILAAVLALGVLSLAKQPLAQAKREPMPVTQLERPTNWAQPIVATQSAPFLLHQMQPQLYRSALPSAEAVPQLQALGITTVINFYQKPDTQWLSDPAIEQIHLPLRTNRIDDQDVLQVLRAIEQAEQQGKVLIHCKHGQNRTGLIAAMYRMVYQGWSKAQALAEMQQGFGGEARMEDATRYIQQVDVAAIRYALANGHCSTQKWHFCQISQWWRDFNLIGGAS